MALAYGAKVSNVGNKKYKKGMFKGANVTMKMKKGGSVKACSHKGLKGGPNY